MNEAGAQGEAALLAKAREIARSLFTQTGYETTPLRTDAQFVTDLYYAYTQRGPDAGGLSFWTGQADCPANQPCSTTQQAQRRALVCDGFEQSGEFLTLVSTLRGASTGDNERVEHYIRNLYMGALGREPNATELQQHTQELNTAAAQGQSQVVAQAGQIGRGLFAAQVANPSGNTHTEFVTNLYAAFLQRGPDAGGLAHWPAQAANNRQSVLDYFATYPVTRELAATLYREVNWLVSDHLGTPRMVVDKTGSLAGVKRHDYLPFGEEIGAGVGGRTTGQGYSQPGGIRQGFTGYEKDGETGLSYARARYYSPTQGRFTGVDPILSSVDPTQPQSWNRYAYCLNNPLKYIDPSGLIWVYQDNKDGTVRTFRWYDDEKDVPQGWAAYTGSNYFIGKDEGIFLGAGGHYRRTSKEEAGLGQLDEFLRGPNSPLDKEQKDELQQAFARRILKEHWEIEAISAAVGGALGGITEGTLKGLAGLFVNQGIRNTETALLSGMLRAVSKGKGNFGIGSATVDQVEAMGRAWVGQGYRVASDGKTLLSADGLRQFRPGSFKPNLGKVQANLEWRLDGLTQWQGNAHIDIVP